MKTEEELKNEAVISNLEEAYAVILKLNKRIDKLAAKLYESEKVVTKLYNTPSNCTRDDFNQLYESAVYYLRIYKEL